MLVGGYMVDLAKRGLPEGTLFEALVETRKCLPDAVQLLTLCSAGNQRLKIHPLARFAVTLFDKHTGEGLRVGLDPAKVDAFPELRAWLFKEKPKREQDEARLLAEIEAAGDGICALARVVVKPEFIGHKHMGRLARCPGCGEGYPADDGPLCLGCQGHAPYVPANPV